VSTLSRLDSDIALQSGGWQDVDGSRDPSAFVEYLDGLGEAARANRLRSLVLLGVVAGHRALDVGCGIGDVVVDLASTVAPGVCAIGVDCSETMVSAARVRAEAAGTAIDFVVGDARTLAFGDASFDAVNCERVLQHLDDPESAIAEMARVLVPGGRLMLGEPDWDGLFIDTDDEATTHAVRDALVARLRNPRIGRALRRFALLAGLEVVDFNGGLGSYAVSRTAADRMWNLRSRLDDAVADGTVGHTAANAWWDRLGALDDAGQFFAGVVGFRLLAVKPS
jgi:SAM-dependent methyltransferase